MSTIHCSFCEKSVGEVQRVIRGPNRERSVYICNECVGVCVSILREERGAHECDPFTVMAPRRNWLERLLAPKWWDSQR